MTEERQETCWVCGNIITRYDKVAVLKPVVKERAEIRARADCCPILYADEKDLVHHTWEEYSGNFPNKKTERKEILRLKAVDVFVSQEDDHHLDFVINNEDEVLKDRYPNTELVIALSHVLDRHGQRVTISMTHSYEEYLKKKGKFDGKKLD